MPEGPLRVEGGPFFIESAAVGAGCVKTQAFNLRVESPSRFRQSKEDSAVAAIGKRAIEKMILRLVGS